MNKTRIQIARPDILRHFNELPQKVWRTGEARTHPNAEPGILEARSGTPHKFIKFLLTSGNFSQIVFPFAKPYNREVRYTCGDVDIYDVMLTLKPHCHFSHYTAVHMHGLTEQVPKTTYLNFEQPLESNSQENSHNTVHAV